MTQTVTIYEHILKGCAPVPLAGYLKALGVFRLFAEQADKNAHGFWRDERFVLKTKLTEDQLVRFFAEIYQPSPIISPWNGRAGFLEGATDEESSRKGAQIICCYQSAGDRFVKLRNAVETYHSISIIKDFDKARAEAKPLQEKKRKKQQLSEDEKKYLKELEAFIKRCKESVIANLRSEAPDCAVDWFDACQRITQKNKVFPLLGSGGVDGSCEFGMKFGSALEASFDFKTGEPLENTMALIRESLGFDILPSLGKDNLGQYDPAGGGENITSGFKGEQPFNPIDFILLLEGAILFSGTTTRRLGSNKMQIGFPFTVSALTAGSGATASADDTGFSEFWAPIWTRPTCLVELSSFLTEGRTTVGGKTAKDALEFAVALSTLGSQRGVTAYQRFALLQREPRNPKKALAIGRVHVRESPHASLVSELDIFGWLSCARRVLRAHNLEKIGRNFDEALFRLTTDGLPSATQGVLMAFGALMLEVARRPKLRDVEEGLAPPPYLSAKWVKTADDGSPEFALAAALASLDATGDIHLPFRRHLVPLDVSKNRDSWTDSITEARALAVWTGRNLLRDMALVLERRLIEAQRRNFTHQEKAELSLRGHRTAPLAAVAAFLAGQTDDARIAALTVGLAWCRGGKQPTNPASREDALPFAYAALKPLFAPEGVGEEKKRINPLPLVRLMRAGRVGDAIQQAQIVAQGAGLPAPFLKNILKCEPATSLDPNRLMAALLFPIAPKAHDSLIGRVYPDLKKATSKRSSSDVY